MDNRPAQTMKKNRTAHSPEFKARVALEALKRIKPAPRIASDNETHPVQVSKLKKGLEDQMSEIFERKLGQLIIEWDWLAKKSEGLGLDK